MPAVTCDQMRRLENAAIQAGRDEASLMEEAGRGLAEVVAALLPMPAAAVIFAGKGHNAGDAFIAARHWLEMGWKVIVRPAFPDPATWRPLIQAAWQEIEPRLSRDIPSAGRLVLVDALLGLGTGGALRGPVREACRELNALRLARHAVTVAVDGPSGLDFDSGEADPDAIVADITVTIAVAKTGLFADRAISHVGRLAVVPLPALEPKNSDDAEDGAEILTPRVLRPLLPARRGFDFHKGQAGRVLVVAGSRGFLGAARLCAEAAVRGGAGLVTLAAPVDLYEIAAASVAAEVMVKASDVPEEWRHWPADALAVGPGLGQRANPAFLQWLGSDPRPAVVDADALNALAAAGLARRPGPPEAPRLLTPHPGEMRRLLEAWRPQLSSAPRREQATALARHLSVTVLLKGARTVIATPGQPAAFNTTGHPGMASGGMGDVLAGLSAALLAQGADTHAAACLGSWLLGRAAELALASGRVSPESLLASDVLAHLGPAFEALRFMEA